METELLNLFTAIGVPGAMLAVLVMLVKNLMEKMAEQNESMQTRHAEEVEKLNESHKSLMLDLMNNHKTEMNGIMDICRNEIATLRNEINDNTTIVKKIYEEVTKVD